MFVRSITMSMPSNRYHRSGRMSKNHGRNRADQRAGGRDSKYLARLMSLAPLVRNGRIVHDRKQYIIQYTLWRVSVTTANLFHLNQAPILGAQTAGGSLEAPSAPAISSWDYHRNPGKRGQVLKRIIPFTTIMTLAIGMYFYQWLFHDAQAVPG